MKEYKNITNVDQLDIPPGETGKRELPLDQEARMVDRGAIEVVSESAEPDAPVETSESSSGDEANKTPEEIEAEQKAAEEATKAEHERVEAEQAQARRGSGRGGRG